MLEPGAAGAFICRYDIHPKRMVLAFPDDIVMTTEIREALRTNLFRFHRATFTWRSGLQRKDHIMAALTAAGITMVRDNIQVPPTRAELAQQQRAAHVKDGAESLATFDFSHFPEWAEVNLIIKDKDTGAFVPFVLNDPQRRWFDAMLEQWRRTGRVRQNILKNRQVGISTAVQAFCFYLALNASGVEALVTAHRADAGDAVFRRTKTFENRCPVKLPIERNNKKEIQWKPQHSSALRVGVAGDDADFGRSETRHVYHASEAALYNERGLDAYANIMASIPNQPGTFVWRETTARGQNWFYECWNAPELEGFENFFTGWLDDPTCRLPSIPLDDPCWAKIPKSWLVDEPRLRGIATEMGFDEGEIVEALAWRRRAINERCRSNPKVFLREDPAVADDAFISTGGHVFELEIVDVERRKAQDEENRKPVPRYSIVIEDATPAAPMKHSLLLNEAGPLRIWKHPEAGRPYIIGGDFGRGRNVAGDMGDPEKLDYTTLRVLHEWPDAEGRYEEVAAWHGRMDPDEAADQMVALGRHYNGAMLIPETNHYGMILVAKLVKIHRYPRTFRKERIDRATAQPVRQAPEAHWMEYGWWTGSTEAKETMVEWLQEAVRDRTVLIHDPEAWDELRTFVRDEDGKAGAESGRHDDRVMALSIAVSYLKLHPRERPKSVVMPEAYSPADILDRLRKQRGISGRRRYGEEHFS